MPITILVNGRPLSPQEAVRNQLPLDTILRCPACNSNEVMAKQALTTTRLDGETRDTVPRQQDRWCLNCGHRWAAVLVPEFMTNR